MRKKSRSWFAFAMSLCVSTALAGCGPEALDGSTVETTSSALAASQTFLVSFAGGTIPSNASAVISAAGGTLVTKYANVSIVLARSSSTGFASALRADSRIDSVGLSTAVASAVVPKSILHQAPAARPTRNAQGGADPLSFRQWGMDQIKAPQARAISGGKSSVLVGVLDSGVDLTHPDLAGQVNAAASASCIGGIANPDPALWANDVIGHGTHVSGIIAGKKNNVGIVGVAPGVKLAAVKLAVDDFNDPNFGLVFADAFVCAVDWAVGHDFDLMNASLTIDPFTAPIDDIFCSDQPDRAAIVKMVRRAVLAAAAKKITLVASTGNYFYDLDKLKNPTTGASGCKVIPVQLPRVIGVSAVGVTKLLSFYSDYGHRAVDLTAPGGDSFIPNPLVTDTTASGQVLSSVPAGSLYYQIAVDWNGQIQDCSSGTCSTYAYLQGTSQAAPHVTGVAALAISKFGKMTPEVLHARLGLTAKALPCPVGPYNPGGYPTPPGAATCTTGPLGRTNFYGAGEVDALAATR